MSGTESTSSLSAWGREATRFFHELTPDRILAAVETTGVRCTGRLLTLNSLENRVFEVEIDTDPAQVRSPSDRARIVKFYRPGRWDKIQIGEEHRFLLDLAEADIPALLPLPGAAGETVQTEPESGIHFAVFPKAGGRHPHEFTDDQWRQLGRLLARLHQAGARREAPHRIRLDPGTYGWDSLDFLLEKGVIDEDLEEPYAELVDELCDRSFPWFEEAAVQRLHGDAHPGNLLWNDHGPFWVDFDDMVTGPCVQDLWLVCPGRDADARAGMELLLEGYTSLAPFDRQTLRLIEPLRALRFIHFNAWIAKRWEDPAFPRRFELFGTRRYWQEQMADLRECLELVRAVE